MTYAVRDVVLWAREAKQAGKDLIYLNIGDPCQFDFRTPPHVIEAIVKALRDNRTSYTPSEGIPEALAAIRQDAEERKGIRNIQSIFIGHGASEPIETVLTALVEPGEGVLVPAPGYPLYDAVLAKLGARAVPYALDEQRGWQPDTDAVAKLAGQGVRALVLINPNNPTGAVIPRATLEKLLEVAARHQLLVLSDEIYDRMILDKDVTHTATASLRADVPVATFAGLSKVWLGPGLRVGWCILSGPAGVLDPLNDAVGRLIRARLSASHPVQCAVAAALTGPDDHIHETNLRLRQRRDLVVARVRQLKGWSVAPPQGAFYAFPRVNPANDLELVRELALNEGVVLVHGSGFGRPGFVRIVFLPPEATLMTAFARMERFLAR